MIRASTNEMAGLLGKALRIPEMAGLLNELLGMEGDPKYTDRECEIGVLLFDRLCHRFPEAVARAQRR